MLFFSPTLNSPASLRLNHQPGLKLKATITMSVSLPVRTLVQSHLLVFLPALLNPVHFCSRLFELEVMLLSSHH